MFCTRSNDSNNWFNCFVLFVNLINDYYYYYGYYYSCDHLSGRNKRALGPPGRHLVKPGSSRAPPIAPLVLLGATQLALGPSGPCPAERRPTERDTVAVCL